MKDVNGNQPVNLRRTWRIGVRLVDWAQGFGNRLYGGILDFLREGHSFEMEFVQPSGGDLPPTVIEEKNTSMDRYWGGQLSTKIES
jgi:purine nucleoside permease